jgi:hypothetical protein
MWLFLNWAVGLLRLGCRVVWVDTFIGDPATAARDVATLREWLRHFGLFDLLIVGADGETVAGVDTLDPEIIDDADVLLNLGYDLPDQVVARFRKSVFVDIDPGLTQVWMSRRELNVADHDVYYTFGETVGRSSRIPTCGIEWHHTPPPVELSQWPAVAAPEDAPFTTISNWWGDWVTIAGEIIDHSKRASFLRYLELPQRVDASLELSIFLGNSSADVADRITLERHGWRVQHVRDSCPDPLAARRYITSSAGEFSCLGRGYSVLRTAWIGERAVNYLAAGRPVVIEDTGTSSFLPREEGLYVFSSMDEAAAHFRSIAEDPERSGAAARRLAEEHFDAQKVLPRVLSRVLD